VTLGVRLATAARAPAWVPPLAVGAAGVGACLLLALDARYELPLLPPCPFRFATGLDCPGCGTGRALRALGRGELLAAFDHNLIAVSLLPVLLGVYLAWLWRSITTGERLAPQPPAAAARALAATVVVFAVARNLPWTPFAWLSSSAG